ncbi:MAG: fasciclin domain-containing protein [Actinomycetota bacterium]|jgi:uncharacterized surface protein with fasciclin (FAS1) repeats
MQHRPFIAVVTLGAFAALGALGVSTVHADPSEASAKAGAPIAAIASGDPELSIFVEALEVTGFEGLVDACNDAHTTVLAPSDEAFRTIFADIGLDEQEAMSDATMMSEIVAYHLLPGEFDAAAFGAVDHITAVSGQDISVARTGGMVRLNDAAEVTASDSSACNGMVHRINRVLLPPVAAVPPVADQAMPNTGSEHQRLLVEVSAGAVLVGAAALALTRRSRRVAA